MPDSRHRSRSPFMAWAVMATMGTCPPFESGIATSLGITAALFEHPPRDPLVDGVVFGQEHGPAANQRVAATLPGHTVIRPAGAERVQGSIHQIAGHQGLQQVARDSGFAADVAYRRGLKASLGKNL